MTPAPEVRAALKATPPRRWRVGAAELDERSARLSVDGCPVALDRSSYDLLLCLVDHVGQTVAKDALLRAGWPGRVVSENSLAKAIGRLRVALGDADGEWLRVVHGYGYRLTAPVELLVDAGETAEPAAVDATPPASAAAPPVVVAPAASVPPSNAGARWRPALMAIGVLALALVVWVYWTMRMANHGPPAAAGPPSIAVLPFVDLSPQQDQGHFSDGLADQLLDDLARMPNLRVVARTSSFAFRGKEADVKEIGHALDASTVLEGSVRRSNDRIRVTVQLINAANGFHLWSQTYDRPMTELFKLQDDIARAIAHELSIELLPEQFQGQHGTSSPEAYEQVLLAHTLFKDDETSNRHALDAYQRAVEIDPSFVDAWLGLADVLGHSGLYADSAEEALAGKHRAMDALDTAIRLQPARAESYLQRGDFRYAHWWDWYGAEEDLEKAAALGLRNDSNYLLRVARLRAALGRMDEAIALGGRAFEMTKGATGQVLGYHLLSVGRYEEARSALDACIRVQPLDEHAHYYLGLVELLQGHPQAALPHFEASAHYLRLTGLAMAEHSRGDHVASERDLQVLIARFAHITPYQAADVYAWRGETDRAFQFLNRAVELHDASIMYLKFDPLLNSLRADPRWAALLKRVKLPA